jgi:hypothetical protein
MITQTGWSKAEITREKRGEVEEVETSVVPKQTANFRIKKKAVKNGEIFISSRACNEALRAL